MEYEKEFIQEQQYLDKTCTFIRENLQREEQACSDEKEQIISARKEMWENVSFRGGFDNAVEAHQALESIQAQSGRYDAAHKRIDHYRQALDSPYFARIDFTEQGFESSPAERIYIGLFTVQDEESYEPTSATGAHRLPVCFTVTKPVRWNIRHLPASSAALYRSNGSLKLKKALSTTSSTLT